MIIAIFVPSSHRATTTWSASDITAHSGHHNNATTTTECHHIGLTNPNEYVATPSTAFANPDAANHG
jgi:hypothetical protein